MVNHSRKLLITGGLGYVGGRVANHLARFMPRSSIRLSTRRSKKEVPEWAEDIDIAQTNFIDTNGLSTALRGVDTVIHLAAANYIDCGNDPDLALEVNG